MKFSPYLLDANDPAVQARLDTCGTCERLVKSALLPDRCGKCGCVVIAKTRKRMSRCPLGKWPPRSDTGTYETPDETAPDLAGGASYYHSGSEMKPTR